MYVVHPTYTVYSCQQADREISEKDRPMSPKSAVQDARREPLTAARIVTAAMTIADREGLEALSLLRGLGFTSEEAVMAHWTLTGFTMGHVMWQLASPLFDDEGKASHMLDHERALPAAEFPCIVAALPFLEACDMDTAFEFGIDALI